MSLITKRRLIIILIVLTSLVLYSIYTIRTGSKQFEILDINNVYSINDPDIKIAIEAAEECNKLETAYRNDCYIAVSYNMGRYYTNIICEILKEKLKPSCYSGYGKSVGEKYSPDIKTIQDECSKTKLYELCLLEAALAIGEESSRHIETEQCQEFKQEDIKQRCYDGLGRQLAKDNKEQALCKSVKNEDACLLGFAGFTDKKGGRGEALEICNQLDEENIKKCYSIIGGNSIYSYDKTIQEAFSNCEQYFYSEDCKKGIARVIAHKFFEEKQQKNEETASVTTPAMFAIYKIKNIVSTIKQKIIPPFINHKLTYLTIILLSIGMILAIRALRNKKVQKVIKKLCEGIRTTTQKAYYISIKKLFITYNFSTEIILQIYKKLKIIIQDILSIDKTTITSFSKELKTELGSKEGKKKL